MNNLKTGKFVPMSLIKETLLGLMAVLNGDFVTQTFAFFYYIHDRSTSENQHFGLLKESGN